MPKRGENIYKRKDNRWEARFEKGRDENGKIKYGYCYARTYKEVRLKLFSAKKLYQNNQYSRDNAKKMFSDFILDWLRVRSIGNTESTNSKYWYVINNHILPFFQNVETESLSTNMVFEFSNGLLNEKQLSGKTVFDILVILKSVIKFAAKQIPSLNTLEIVFPKVEKKEPEVLTRAEQTLLIDYLTKNMDLKKFGTLLSLMTGIRIGELCALQTKDISLEEKTLHVCKTMQRIKNHGSETKTKIVITPPKSDKSNRIIPLSDWLVLLCKKMLTDNREAYLLTSCADSVVEPRIMQKEVKKYGKACCIENLHFHVLRHTFATRCVEENFDIKSLSEILGHKSVQITLERYVHSSMEFKRSNMEKMTKVFEPSDHAVN